MGREVRARRFDLVLSPHRSLRSCWLARRSGAPRRVGYRESAWPGAFTDLVRRPRDGHEIEKVLALLAPLGITPPDNPRPELAVGTAERERARELAGGKPYAVIAPAAAWETKRWLPEGFAAVADHLARARGLRVVLTGAPGDEAAGAAVARAAARAAVTDLVGRTSTREMMALTAEAAVVVANDSAPVHVAAAFDVPTVAVFGATVPTQGFGPRSTRSEVVEVTVLDCRPCGAHGGRKCPVKHFKCMHELEASAVTAAVDRVLARTASP
jgi:heptosyltransferase-2